MILYANLDFYCIGRFIPTIASFFWCVFVYIYIFYLFVVCSIYQFFWGALLRLLFCLFPYYYSLCPCFQNLVFSFIPHHWQKTPGLLPTHSLEGSTLPTPFHRSFSNIFITVFLFIIYFVFCFILNRIFFNWTNTVRTKVAKTAKSELRFCLFVILLFLLLPLVSIRNKDLQKQNPDHINYNKRPWYASYYPTWWNYIDSGLRQTTFTPSSGAILWVSWFSRLSPGDSYRSLVDTAERYCGPIATAYPVWHTCVSPPTVSCSFYIDSPQDRLTDRDQLSQSLDTSRTDSRDNSLDISLPELPIKI